MYKINLHLYKIYLKICINFKKSNTVGHILITVLIYLVIWYDIIHYLFIYTMDFGMFLAMIDVYNAIPSCLNISLISIFQYLVSALDGAIKKLFILEPIINHLQLLFEDIILNTCYRHHSTDVILNTMVNILIVYTLLSYTPK